MIYLSIFSLISHYYTTLWSSYCCFVVLTMSLVVHLYHSSCSICLILHFSLCRVIFNMHCFAWISILTILLIWSSFFFQPEVVGIVLWHCDLLNPLFCEDILLFDLSTDLFINFFSNLRLLELLYGIIGAASYDTVIGDICSLPSHLCHS